MECLREESNTKRGINDTILARAIECPLLQHASYHFDTMHNVQRVWMNGWMDERTETALQQSGIRNGANSYGKLIIYG
jgi:hypothetical protein